MIKLAKGFTLIVPTKDNEGRSIDWQAPVKELASVAGGATVNDCEGYWTDKGILYKDVNKAVQVSYMDTNENAYQVTRALGSIVMDLLGDAGKQLAVSVQGVTGLMIFDQTDTFQSIQTALMQDAGYLQGTNAEAVKA